MAYRTFRPRGSFGHCIGCYGPGGKFDPEAFDHLNFFDHTEATELLVNAWLGRQQTLAPVDPRAMLPGDVCSALRRCWPRHAPAKAP